MKTIHVLAFVALCCGAVRWPPGSEEHEVRIALCFGTVDEFVSILDEVLVSHSRLRNGRCVRSRIPVEVNGDARSNTIWLRGSLDAVLVAAELIYLLDLPPTRIGMSGS